MLCRLVSHGYLVHPLDFFVIIKVKWYILIEVIIFNYGFSGVATCVLLDWEETALGLNSSALKMETVSSSETFVPMHMA